MMPRELLLERAHATDVSAAVCITLYNYETHIVDALSSVYDQTLDNLGLVVVDDASTDRGVERVREWLEARADRFAAVRLARHGRNGGLAAARNSAVELSPSEFAMVLDADNQLYPRCVERLWVSLRDSPCGFAYSIIEQFDARVGLMGCNDWRPELLKQGNYIDAMAMVRRSAWERVGGYTKMEIDGWEDYEFWCKLVDAGIDGVFVPEILARYRLHESSMLRTATDVGKNREKVRREMCDRHPWLALQ